VTPLRCVFLTVIYSVEYDSAKDIVTVGVRRKVYREIGKCIERNLQKQLSDCGNSCFYKALAGSRVAEDIIQLGPAESPCRAEHGDFRQPDGALSVPQISPKPLVVIEVTNNAPNEKAYERCVDWMTYHKGLINFVVLVKLVPWPKVNPRKGEAKTVGNVVGMFHRMLQPNSTSAKATVSTSEYAQSGSAGLACSAGMHPTIVFVDDENLSNDEGEPDQGTTVPFQFVSSMTHEYRRATVSVYGTQLTNNKRHMRGTEIENMEVWPALPVKPWRFTMSDILEDDTPEDLKDIELEISFQFLHAYLDENMAIKRVAPLRRGDPESVEASPLMATKSFFTHRDQPRKAAIDDKKTLLNLSPPETPKVEVSAPTASMGVGTFCTLDIRPWYKPRTHHNVEKMCTPPYTIPPRVAVGLEMLDLEQDRNIRIKASATNIRSDNFTLAIDSWADTIMYSAGCSWLELGAGTDDIQTGVFRTTDIRPWHEVQERNEQRVTFDRSFADNRPPKVVVWLSALDMDKGFNWRAKAYASDITARGFTVHVDSWEETKLYSAWVTWVAYPSNSTEICSGQFGTGDIRPWYQPRHHNTGQVAFGDNVKFEKTPQVVAALSSLDYEHGINLRLWLKTSAVTTRGFAWTLESWEDSKMYSSSAMYIAFAGN
jgi:hypothetical protein